HLYAAYANGNSTNVAKLDATSGGTLWEGSVGNAYGTRGAAGLAVDATGYVYAAGGSGPFFLAKLAPATNRSLQQPWNRKFKGTNWASGVAVDLRGNVYTMGSFAGTVDFDPGHGTEILKSAAGSYDEFLSELSTNGSFVTAADIVYGSGEDYGHAVAVDTSSP